MPRYKLRTLLIVLALGPPVLAGAWSLFCRNPRLIVFGSFVFPFIVFWMAGVSVLLRHR
jgi:hypothetical protein